MGNDWCNFCIFSVLISEREILEDTSTLLNSIRPKRMHKSTLFHHFSKHSKWIITHYFLFVWPITIRNCRNKSNSLVRLVLQMRGKCNFARKWRLKVDGQFTVEMKKTKSCMTYSAPWNEGKCWQMASGIYYANFPSETIKYLNITNKEEGS